jgi:hypothetical protein|eukprot:CAMPEP_0174325374 /NCGR_PEP_ID=MMETSP0810-20121108/13209_1 /TAXON_ID=73025 ORGANISM="Eutreptiella gymnastica-like, Strain CCMP1594" /NCGR_SAMPLE_ID=MMETSP0810 /ASSEMBLY_ACC=CAM_ASM_000659 /LENGTH=46 /DNA_ID= /DNA_START= /DNA_END= /DNA_ORIENTATION=
MNPENADRQEVLGCWITLLDGFKLKQMNFEVVLGSQAFAESAKITT